MDASKKLSSIFARSRSTKNPQFSQVEQQAGHALIETIGALDADSKKYEPYIEINRVIEIPMGKEKPAILIYLSHKSHKLLLFPLYKKLVADLEKRLKTTVLLVAARNIQSRWVKKNRTQKRPYSRTLTSVQQALLTELLLPATVISDRTRVRLDGSQVRKVVVDKSQEHFLEERTDAIKNAYKKLTNRQIEIGFEKEPHYYTLKQGERQK